MERREPPTLGPEPNNPANQWAMDPRDVQRYARRRRDAKRVGPLGRLFRYSVLGLLLAGAGVAYWNIDTLAELRFDFSRVTSVFAGSGSRPAGARPTDGAPGTEIVDGGGVAGVSMPTSLAGEEPDEPDPPPLEAADRAPVEAAAAAAAPEPRPAPPPAPELPPRPETIGFGLEVMRISEADASAAVLVLRDGGRRGVSAFTWWTTDGAATAGSDFARLDARVERFGVGEQNRTVHVPIIGDRSAEGPENFFVHVVAGEARDAPGATAARIEVIINDDD